MKFANIRELKLETKKVLEMSEKNGPVVILRNGKPIAVLSAITKKDFSLKIDSLWPKLRKAAERAGYGPEDVENLVESVRQSK